MHEATVKVARRLVRARVRLWYCLALLWGDYGSADKCKAWLDGDQLYPLEDQ